MNRYHFRVYTGPTAVQQVADRLRASAQQWQALTIEGTEHVHYSIEAIDPLSAETEAAQWFTRAGFGPTFPNRNSMIRTEAL